HANLTTRPRVKPLDPVKLDRIAPGAMCGLKKQGHGWPARMVRDESRKKEVTLPSYVARELGVVAGNFVVWCCTKVPGLLTIAEVAAVYERDIDGSPILGGQVGISKVRKSTKSFVITIPKKVLAELGDVTGEQIAFVFTLYPRIVAVNVIKRPEDSKGAKNGA
ncbi:unnamed protein product, partial [marine sediment metagenome]